LKENNVPHGSMKKVIELLLCLLGSNTSIEKCFPVSIISVLKRCLFHVDTVQVILSVKINTDLSYEASSEKLATNPGVLKKIHSSDKYHAIARTSS
jgi:hypothetical protein